MKQHGIYFTAKNIPPFKTEILNINYAIDINRFLLLCQWLTSHNEIYISLLTHYVNIYDP